MENNSNNKEDVKSHTEQPVGFPTRSLTIQQPKKISMFQQIKFQRKTLKIENKNSLTKLQIKE